MKILSHRHSRSERRAHNLRPSLKPLCDYDGWTEPSNKDVEPQDLPWENAKI
jgi:hypothetical protein